MSKDSRLITDCILNAQKFNEAIIEEFSKYCREDKSELRFVYPLDNAIIGILKDIIKNNNESDQFFLFHKMDKVVELWNTLIEKSIICLRFFDKREPFLENDAKSPVAYGIKELKKYFDKYIKFENVLYGGAKYYRDHIIHVIRVWLLGINSLLSKECRYLNSIEIAPEFETNKLEKISIWTIISLTHDLGYPLEKAQNIIDSTRKMMKCFISEPNISIDLSFNGVQNNMNDYVLRFMSSKMIAKNNGCPQKEECPQRKDSTSKVYVTRLQSKYYFKFQKSLENFRHGTISAIVIYKLLLFFLESDFTINEDYEFKHEDARQFYIRREILRSIASHTCTDIYHLKISSFAILLIIADDCQEWGRKSISELYNRNKVVYDLDPIKFIISNDKKVEIKETYDLGEAPIDKECLLRILKEQYNQFCHYTSLFRDGQDTKNRDFSYSKSCTVSLKANSEITYTIDFTIANKDRSIFKLKLSCSQLDEKYQEYGYEIFNKNFNQYIENTECNNQTRHESIPLKVDESQHDITFIFRLPKPDDRIE